jgi:hypothetical protein
MQIKMLTPACEESKRMVDWVEKGALCCLLHGHAWANGSCTGGARCCL